MEILVVDDDPDIRSLLTFTLEDAGYRTREAPDGAAAIAVLREKPPCCVVLDVMMPGVDGFEVLSARQRFGFAPSTRVVLLTAKTAETDFVRGWELGADEYVTKPFDPDELVDAIDVVLAATPLQLEQRRRAELDKASMLNQLDAAFRSRRPLSR